jgi:hypothetical protein
MKHGYRSTCKTRRAQILALFSFVGVAGNLCTWTRPDLMINYMHTRRNTPSTFRSNSSNCSMCEIFIPNPNASSSPRLVIWRMSSWWFKGSWKLCWWSFPWWLGDVQLWHGPPGSTWWSSSPCWLIRTHEFLFHLFLSFCSTYVCIYIYYIIYTHTTISRYFCEFHHISFISHTPIMFIGDFVPKAEPGFRLAAALKERGHEPLVVSWRFQGGCRGWFQHRGFHMGEPQASLLDGLPSGKLT